MKIEACLLLIFFVFLQTNKLTIHSIVTYYRIQMFDKGIRMFEKGDSSNRLKMKVAPFGKF